MLRTTIYLRQLEVAFGGNGIDEHREALKNNHLRTKRRISGHEERRRKRTGGTRRVWFGRGYFRFPCHGSHRVSVPRCWPVGRFDIGFRLLPVQRIAEPKQLHN